MSSRSGLVCLPYKGLQGVADSRNDSSTRSTGPPSRWTPPRYENSFTIPTTLRFAVLASATSAISDISSAMNEPATPCADNTSPNAAGNRPITDAAGASGTNTGNSVVSFTNNATCGFQNSTVAYQQPSRLVEAADSVRTCPPTRSRNFFVPWTTYTPPFCAEPKSFEFRDRTPRALGRSPVTSQPFGPLPQQIREDQENTMENQRLTLTVPEVAEMVGVSRAHAYELIRLGRIPSIRLGRRLIVPRKALEDFLEHACSLDAS